MSRFIHLFTQVYSALLHFYPSQFRAEFADEMQLVFEDALKQAMLQGNIVAIAFCLRELRDLPRAILYENWRERRSGKMNSSIQSVAVEQRRMGTPRQVITTMLPFALYGFFNWLNRVSFPDMYGKTVAPVEPFLIGLAGYFVLLIGLGIGCAKGFPRWSFGYIGLAISMAIGSMGMPTQGLWRFGIYFSNSWTDLLEWRAWIPFALTILIALTFTRSLQPIKQFAIGIWNDWTRGSLAWFGFLTWLTLIYDEVHHPYLNAFILASAIVMTVGAGAFEWIGGTWQRIVMLLLTLPALGVLNTILWSTGAYYSMPPPPVTSEPARQILQAIVAILFCTLILYSPGVVGLVRRFFKPMQYT